MEGYLRFGCNSCMEVNISGNRYKCLVCYDYDLCHICHQNGRNNFHESNHPMQFIDGITNEGIVCDWCRNVNFLGRRYKCMICKDYDLCFSCHMAVSQTEHASSHPVQRINNNTNIGISCDVCHASNFIGTRFKCLICADFDSCFNCLICSRDGKNNCHVSNHPMQLIDEISNPGINCDSCHKTNFEGNRYRCMICRDYDLCSSCRRDLAVPQHSWNHLMEYIDQNSNVIKRNNVSESYGCSSTYFPRDLSVALECMILDERGTEERSISSLQGTETNVRTAPPPLNTGKQTLPGNSSSIETVVACKEESTKTNDDDDDGGGDDDEDKKLCIICYQREYNTVLVPCGHMWLCFECATSVNNGNKLCPACRTRIEKIIRVYTPN